MLEPSEGLAEMWGRLLKRVRDGDKLRPRLRVGVLIAFRAWNVRRAQPTGREVPDM